MNQTTLALSNVPDGECEQGRNGERQQMGFGLTHKQGDLPFWPEDIRGLPASAVRSALFAPVKRGARAYLERVEIKSIGDYKIVFTGNILDQADLDVYLQVVHLARKLPLGSTIYFKAREFLRDIGRDTGSSQRKWLLRSITRLGACQVEISKGGETAYSRSLIPKHQRDIKRHFYGVELDPSLATLFMHGWSALNPDQRQALGDAQLAKWLHAFTSGQNKPLTFRVDTLADYANSRRKRMRDFRAHLSDACEQIRVSGRPLRLLWSSDRTKVTITRDEWMDKGMLSTPTS